MHYYHQYCTPGRPRTGRAASGVTTHAVSHCQSSVLSALLENCTATVLYCQHCPIQHCLPCPACLSCFACRACRIMFDDGFLANPGHCVAFQNLFKSRGLAFEICLIQRNCLWKLLKSKGLAFEICTNPKDVPLKSSRTASCL